MKYRKVQEVGKGTLMVSIPKEWVEKYSVKKGDVLKVEVSQAGELVVSTLGEVAELKEAVVYYDTKEPEVSMDKLIGAYLLGYDAIKVLNLREVGWEERERIEKMLKKLAGLEVVGENEDSITLQFVIDSTLLNPRTVLNRIYMLSKKALADSLTSLLQADEKLARSAIDTDDEIDRLYFLLVRLIRSAMQRPEIARAFSLSAVECLDQRVAASLLESIGDYSCELARNAGKVSNAQLSAICGVEGMLSGMFSLAMEAYVSGKVGLEKDVKALSGAVDKMLRNLKEATLDKPSEVATRVLSVASTIDFVRKAIVDIADLSTPRI